LIRSVLVLIDGEQITKALFAPCRATTDVNSISIALGPANNFQEYPELRKTLSAANW